ncbi:CBS domain-containing protein [Caldalkalibacillus mannanilyticus]|uniref:CBS domain-containing protein n=1 Tax=Caldalkalibacillus mannanilyticus TaxID=1418 RepID=UPI0009DE115E|nr:CBS domain-containing protein [Caldalkalibacillus mannanilyticus]
MMNASLYMIPISSLSLSKENDTIGDTLKTMKDGSFKTLPVVDESNHFIGVINASDLYEAFFLQSVSKEAFLTSEIRPFVKKGIKVIHKNTDFLQVILQMEKMDIHFLPCVDDYNRFLGIISRNNIFQAFESAFGYNQDGYLIEVITIDAKGQLAKLAQIITETNSNIISILQFDLTVAGLERIIVKVQSIDIDKLLNEISDAGFRITHHRYVPALTNE